RPLDGRSVRGWRQRDSARPSNGGVAAAALDVELIAVGLVTLAHRHSTAVGTLHGGDSERHRGFVGARRDFFETFTAGQASLQGLRTLQHVPYLLLRGSDESSAGKVHRFSERAGGEPEDDSLKFRRGRPMAGPTGRPWRGRLL